MRVMFRFASSAYRVAVDIGHDSLKDCRTGIGPSMYSPSLALVTEENVDGEGGSESGREQALMIGSPLAAGEL